MTAESVQDVATMLHSVVSCEKNGIPLQRLEREYQTLIGTSIPFRKFGHATLESFIKSLPEVIALEVSPSGQVLVKAVVRPTTAHVARLVGEQRTVAKGKPVLRPSRHPAPRTGPSVRFASYQAQLNNGGCAMPGMGGHQPLPIRLPNELQLNPLATARRAMRMRTSLRGLPQLKTISRWSQQELRGQHAGDRREMPPVPNNSLTGIDTAEPVAWVPSSWGSALGPGTQGTASPPRHHPVSPTVSAPQIQAVGTPEFQRIPMVPPTAPSGKTCRDLVEEYSVARGLPLAYNTLSSKSSKRGPLMWLSTLKLSERTFNSYPVEKPTKAEAEEEAARKAVEALNIQEGGKDELPVTPVSTLQQMQEFVDRIKDLVAAKPNGLWNTVIPDVYRDHYEEDVPPGWLNLVRQTGALCITELKENRCILYPRPTASVASPLSFQGDLTSSDSDVGSPSAMFPDPIVFPDGCYWDIFVTSTPSTSCVFFRLVDYSEKYDELANEMDRFYSDDIPPAMDLYEDNLYAVLSDDSWLRVQLLELTDSKAECLFVDHGDVDVVDASRLRNLESRFFTLPFQAVQCQLEGLSEFADDERAVELLEKMVFGKVLVAEVVSREEPVTAVLYDTTTDVDINLNVAMLKEMLMPQFPGIGEIAKANLCHVTPAGDLHVQVHGYGTRTLSRYLEAIEKHLETSPQPAKDLSLSKMYVCRDDVTGKLGRVVVVSPADKATKKVEVHFVDHSKNTFVSQSELHELLGFEDSMARLPYQVLSCRLGGVLSNEGELWNEKAASRLLEMAPQSLELLLKVAGHGNTGIPLVELFKRIEPNNELVSINASLAVAFSRLEDRPEKQTKMRRIPPMTRMISQGSLERRTSDPGRQRSTSMSCSTPSPRNSVTTPPCDLLASEEDDASRLPPLSAPELPDVRQYLDVNVTVAANPLNFVCQPWCNGALLRELMTDMQMFYNGAEGRSAFPEGLPEELLREGEFYAGHHPDDLWYRVLVRQVQDQQMASVYYVDYGDYGMLSLAELQPLWRRYRKLPVQAVHAQLSRVAPISGDWNPVDCLSFRNIVQNKLFVAMIMGKTADTTTGIVGAQRLSLRLVDTSTDVDVRIDRLLAEQNIVRLLD